MAAAVGSAAGALAVLQSRSTVCSRRRQQPAAQQALRPQWNALSQRQSRLAASRRQRHIAVCAQTDQKEKKGWEADMERFRETERRWEGLVRDGVIRSITSSEAAKAVKNGTSTLLDVRPEHEYEKAHIEGSVHVPVYNTNDSAPLTDKLYMTVSGGTWWMGMRPVAPNRSFGSQITSQLDKDANIIVACQKGLRSLSACEKLVQNGYKNVSWMNGGFEAARSKDWEPAIAGTTKDLRCAGLGGLSYWLGWTNVQRKDPDQDASQRATYWGRAIGLFLLVDLLIYGAFVAGK
eukprot:jgi/Chlat1/69/Chrsp1S00208